MQVEWDNEAELILHVEFIDQWTWDEVSTTFVNVVQLMERQSGPFSMLIDLTHSAGIAPDALTQAFRVASTFPENWEFCILIGGGAIVQTMVRVFSQLHPTYRSHLRLADSVEEARDQIASHRQAPSQA
jgi:hypothetical protein